MKGCKPRWCCSLLLALAALESFGAPHRFPDPTSSWAFPECDLVGLEVEVVDGVLAVALRYAAALELTDGNYGTLFIDGDLDPDTGVSLGAEAILDFVFTGVYTGGSVLVGDHVISLGQQGTVVEAGPDHVLFRLPLALWSGQVPPRLFATSSHTIASTSYDRAPDAGWLEVASGLAVLPRPGNAHVQAVCEDPAQDAVWPDLTACELRVANGNLLIWVTFAHGVEPRHLQEVQDALVVNLSFDVDRRLWTGFRNSHEVPPSYGIDRQIQILLSHVCAGPSAVLRWQRRNSPQNPTAELLGELEGIGLGDQHFDTRCVVGASAEFGTAENQIFLSIPLAYFDYCDAQMLVLVEALLETATAPGHSDALPDQGAFDTRAGLTPAERSRPVATCTQPEQVEADLPDDSAWGGYQGDEIIQTRTCPLSDGGLEVRVDLEQLEYSDMAFVNVFVDTDGSLATGIPVANNSPDRLGADLCVSCQFSRAPEPTVVSAFCVDLRRTPFWPEPLRVAHLVSARPGGVFGSQTPGGFFVLNLPPEVLREGSSGVARYVVTTTRQAYSATDQTRYHEKEEDEEEPGVKRSGIIHITPVGRSAVVDSAPNTGFYTVARLPAPPLAILGLRPASGSPRGGTLVTITGRGFPAGAEVWFGDHMVPAGQARLVSSGELSVVSPADAPGTMPVSVRDPRTGESAVASYPFAYATPEVLAPRVLSVEPSLGPIAGGNTVEIRGANFVEGAGVQIGGRQVLSRRRDSPFRMIVQVPPGDIGPATVAVTNPDGTGGLLAGGYNYGARPPEVWTLVPGFGPVAGGTEMMIVGEGFEAGGSVHLGGQPLRQLRFESAGVLIGNVPPANAPGPADLTVRNPSGVRRLVPAAFHYGRPDPQWPAPTILGVTPMSSPPEGGVSVQVVGTGFSPGAAVFFDTTPARISHFDPNLIEATTPPRVSGMVAVRVHNVDGKVAELPADQGWNSFTYDAQDPWLSLVNPMRSPTTGGEEITLFGSNFRPGARVEFGGVPAVSVDISESVIFAVTPPHPPGPVAIRVTNPGGLTTLYEGDIIFGQFEYHGPPPGAPQVNRLVPAEGSVLGGDEVRLEGADLCAGVRVFFAGKEAAQIRQALANSVTVRVPAASPGAVDIEIRNLDGQSAVLSAAFRYVVPVASVRALTPDRGPAAGGTVVTLQGANMLPDATVTFGGLAAEVVRWMGTEAVMVTVPPGIPGAAIVELINPGAVPGSGSTVFTYEGDAAPAPQIERVEPDRGGALGGTPVVVLGQGFLAGATVAFGDRALTDVAVVSPRHVTGRAPPGQAGAVTVEVRNRDGQHDTMERGYTYVDPQAPSPEVHSIAPASGPASGDTPVAVRGAHFQPGARVFFGTMGLPDWEWVEADQLEGRSPPGDPGTVRIRVVNPDGQRGLLDSAFTYLGEITRPRFRSVTFENGQLWLAVEDLVVNTRYVLECSDRLGSVEWKVGHEFVASADSLILAETLDDPSVPARFYRIRALE